ncbi:MAG: 8-oxo-dGTP diphosphatase [Patescibacteria group bacterium]|nr:8-oxo-dGTP diphosphatase [Patescibacteria group bacterium]
MKLCEYRKSLTKPLRQSTLCLIVREGQILLAMKKRGFGQGRWNGVGGKLKRDESIKEAAIREAQEEIGITPLSLKKVATLHFLFPEVPPENDWNQEVMVYLVDRWEGQPIESEEMAPKWFNIAEIPFESMWSDDIHWLPKVLGGTFIEAAFMFDRDQKLLEFEFLEGLGLS